MYKKYNKFNPPKINCQCLILGLTIGLLLGSIGIANAALSAVTAKTIKGGGYFTLNGAPLNNLDELMFFTYVKPDGTIGTANATMDGTTITVKAGTQYSTLDAMVPITGSQETLQSLVQQTTNPLQVSDGDGDATIIATNGATGSITAVLSRNGGAAINVTTSTDSFDSSCDSYKLTLTLTPVTISGVKKIEALTQYGDPYNSINYYSGIATPTKVVSYNIKSDNSQICNIQPKSLNVYGSSTCGPSHCKWPLGYNPAFWDVGKGFNKKALTTAPATPFPTTGFDKAELRIIGSGTNQNLFTCRIKAGSGSWVKLDTTIGVTGTNCTVIYDYTATTGAPTGAITIEMGMGSTWTKIDEYTIPAPTKWAIGGLQKTYGNATTLAGSTSFPALEYCRTMGANARTTAITKAEAVGHAGLVTRQKFLYNREELTNIPWADSILYPEYNGVTVPYGSGVYYSRDADKTFMGEWGNPNDYVGSVWTVMGGSSWTAEAYSASSQFGVNAAGTVLGGYNANSSHFRALCRGE